MSEQDTYQAEYDKAMEQLEAGKPITPAPDEEAKPQAEAEKTPDELQELKEKLERQEKSLKDTQRWGHNMANKVAQLERERIEAQKAAARPEILDANPGLEDAIKHVAQPKPEKNLAEVLQETMPDLENLLDEPEFKEKFLEARDNANGSWENPLTAIRDISSLRTEYHKQKAVANAQKDFADKKKKLDAMAVPGGSSGKDVQKQVDEAQKVWDMPKKDFEAQRRKVLGYS